MSAPIDPDRFESVYRGLYPDLVTYLFRLTGDPDAAEDVAQEAFVRLLRRPDLGAGRCGSGSSRWPPTWCATGGAASRGSALLEAWPWAPPAAPPPDEEPERRERVEGVRAALARLLRATGRCS